MLYASSPKNPKLLLGGASEEEARKERAKAVKTFVSEDPEFRAQLFERALPHSNRKPDVLLENACMSSTMTWCPRWGRTSRRRSSRVST